MRTFGSLTCRRAPLIGAVMIIGMIGFAVSSGVAMEEQRVPSSGNEPMASPAEAQPSPNPAAATGDSERDDDWQRVPEGGATAPLTIGTPAAQSKPGNAPASPAAQAPSAAPSSPESHAQETPPAPPTPDVAPSAIATPSARPSDAAMLEPPPALDVSGIDTNAEVGTKPLDTEIKQARSPSMAASLRLTEEARKDLAKGRTDAALRSLARAVSIDPGDPFEYYYLGRAHFLRKNYQQALTFFQRAQLGFASKAEWLGETLSYAGACDEELGRAPEAAKAYQRAVGLAPGNFRARVGYGRLSARLAPATSLDMPPPVSATAPPPPLESSAPPVQ